MFGNYFKIGVLLITLWAGCDLEAWAGFQPQVTYAVGSNPVAAVLKDFNHDSFLDIAVVNQDDNSVSILLNNGDGTFNLTNTYPVGSLPISIVTADFNGDGIPDLAVLNAGDNTVSVLLGNLDGTFQVPLTFSVSSFPTFLVTGDFTGDAIQDLVVSYSSLSSTPNTCELFLGNGDGTFNPVEIFNSVGTDPSSMTVADFTGDGLLDIGIANASDSTISVLLGNGDGTFQQQITYPVGNIPVSIAAGRLTSTDFIDLVTANFVDFSVSVLLGSDDGTFQPQTTYLVGLNPTCVALADITSSGNLDIATANSGDNTITVLAHGSYNTQNTFPVGNCPSYIVLGDLNNNGLPDAVVTNSCDNTISVLLNKLLQTITFPPIPKQVYSTAYALRATASSGLPVTFTLVSGPATISGNIITFTGLGTVVVAANQAGNDQFAPAPQVNQSIVVTTNFRGTVIKERFLTQTDIVYQLKWVPSSDPNVTQYALFRNGVLIALKPASGPFGFQDHHRRKGEVNTYTLQAQNSVGTPLYVSSVTLGN